MAAPISYKDPYYDALDTRTEAKLGLHPGLLRSIRVNGERSNANQSPASTGARSVYQIIPATRNAVLKKYGVDAYLSADNAAMASGLILKEGQDRNGGDPERAAAEYIGGTDKRAHGPTTRSYVSRVMAGLNPISSAYAGEDLPQAAVDEFTAWKAKQAAMSAPEPGISDMPASDIQPDAPPDELSQQEMDDFNAWKQAQGQPAPQAEAQGQSQPIEDAAIQGLKNLPGGLVNMAIDTGKALIHPVDTATGIAGLARGAMQSIMPDDLVDWMIRKGITPQDDRPKAQALIADYAQSYGGWDNIKTTLAEHPERILSDIAMFAGGAGAAGKLTPGARAAEAARLANAQAAANTATAAGLAVPEAVIRPANIVEKVGSALNPVEIVGKGAAKMGNAAVDVLGATTGTGGAAVRQAFKAGQEGGSKAVAFTGAMGNEANIAEVVPTLKNALKNMRTERGAQYRSGMLDISGDPAILDMNKVENAVKSSTVGKFKDYVHNKSAAATQAKIMQEIDDYKARDPAEYHTVEGFDALKKSMGDIRDSTDFGTPSRLIADNAYHAVKKQIVDQAPAYGKVMKDYELMSNTIGDIEKSLSLGDKAGLDTTIRKLQSVLRNNVNTNFGNRRRLVDELEKYGASDALSSLAGQSMNTWAPRGIGGGVMGLQAGYGIANPATLAAIPFQSPKLVGKLAYGAGKLSGSELSKLSAPAVKKLVLAAKKNRGATTVATNVLSRQQSNRKKN